MTTDIKDKKQKVKRKTMSLSERVQLGKAPGYTSLLIWAVPEWMKTRFKKECQARHLSMREVVISFLHECVRNPDGWIAGLPTAQTPGEHRPQKVRERPETAICAPDAPKTE